MKRLCEAESSVVHQHLRIFETLRVFFQIELNEMRVLIDPLERRVGLIVFAISDLFDGHLGHGVDELRVKVALISRACLLGAGFELAEGLGVGNAFIDSGVDRRGEEEE